MEDGYGPDTDGFRAFYITGKAVVVEEEVKKEEEKTQK